MVIHFSARLGLSEGSLWVGTIKFLFRYNEHIRKCELFSSSTHLCFSKFKSKLR